MTASLLLAWAMLSAVRPSSLRALTSAPDRSSKPAMVERWPAAAIIKAVRPPGLAAFTFAPCSISEGASSLQPGIDASIQGEYPALAMGALTAAPAPRRAPAALTLP